MIQKKAKTKSVSRVMNTNENTALALRIRKLCLPISCDDGEHVGGCVRSGLSDFEGHVPQVHDPKAHVLQHGQFLPWGPEREGAVRQRGPALRPAKGGRALRRGARGGELEAASRVPSSFSVSTPRYASPRATLRRAAGTTPYPWPSPGEGTRDRDAHVGNFKNKSHLFGCFNLSTFFRFSI